MNVLEAKLLEAILREDLQEVDTIIKDKPGVLDAMTDDNIPLSFIAAQTGNLPIMRVIAEYSFANFDNFDPEHNTVLHYGAMSGNLELCKYLVERVGMDPKQGNAHLITPFDVARNAGHNDLCAYFAEVCGGALEEMYRNPIRPGVFPDPSICRVGDDYYMVNSTFVFFPCIPVSHSKDLIHWEIIGHAITNPEWSRIEGLEAGKGYWAPDISYYNGRFYICATVQLGPPGTIRRKQMIVSSEKPEGPYSKPVFLEADGIDPSIFNDDDGRRYMLLNRGARIFELNEDATEKISETTLLYFGDNKQAPEGPHLLKKDGYYYLFEAEGGTGILHKVTVSRSKELFGVYEPCPYNPIMTQKDPGAGIQRCGHGKPVMTQNGEWYMVYLCGRKLGGKYSMLGRETAMDPVTWTADGWPIVNMLKGPSCIQKKPDLPEVILEDDCRLDLTKAELSPVWITPRIPEKDYVRIENGTLLLKGSTAPLSSVHSRNILLRRQTDFVFTATAEFITQLMEVGQNEGIVCYYDEYSFITFGMHKTEKGYCIKLCERIGLDDIIHEEHFVDFKEQIISYRVEVDCFKRSFSYKIGDGAWTEYKTLDNVYYLSDEGVGMGRRFTGAMVGMYAYAGEKPYVARIAEFTYMSGETK